MNEDFSIDEFIIEKELDKKLTNYEMLVLFIAEYKEHHRAFEELEQDAQ